jgi:hypothetical protein
VSWGLTDVQQISVWSWIWDYILDEQWIAGMKFMKRSHSWQANSLSAAQQIVLLRKPTTDSYPEPGESDSHPVSCCFKMLLNMVVVPNGESNAKVIRITSMQAVSKRALQLWKLIYIYSEDMHRVLNCHNVAKHTEFYSGIPNVTMWWVLRESLHLKRTNYPSLNTASLYVLERLHLKAYKLSIVQHIQFVCL